MKVHIVYDPHTDCQRILDITQRPPVNDAPLSHTITIEAGTSYVFDKGCRRCRLVDGPSPQQDRS